MITFFINQIRCFLYPDCDLTQAQIKERTKEILIKAREIEIKILEQAGTFITNILYLKIEKIILLIIIILIIKKMLLSKNKYIYKKINNKNKKYLKTKRINNK